MVQARREKPIHFTRHAKNRLRWHGITQEQIEGCVREPQEIEPQPLGKLHVWAAVGSRFLRVTYREENDRIVIITAVLKRRGPRG